MKGSYQYGFFKRLYEVIPDFQVKKVYAVSVGALNAVPIVIRKPELLDKHWNSREHLPFDTIVNEWSTVKSKNTYYKNIERARAFVKNGSIFHSLNTQPCFDILNSVDDLEMEHVARTLVILSFNTTSGKIVFNRCMSRAKTVAAIKSSSMFPGLFVVDSHIIDGATINLDRIIQARRHEPWLCIDLQGGIKSKNHHVFSPKIVTSPIRNITSCLLVDRLLLDDLIENGRQDADMYIKRLSI